MICKLCGEDMEGDGYTYPIHCPNANVERWEYIEPDSNPIECEEGDYKYE